MGVFDINVFNEQTKTVMTETIDQDIAKFNEASGGAIVLINKPFEGDFSIESAFKAIAGLVRRRNAYGSGAQSAKRLQQMLDVAVKVAAGTPPIEFEPQQYRWTLQNPELAAIKIGEQLAKARLADMLNAGLTAGVAAISGNSDMKLTETGKADFKMLNKAAAKMGDRSGSLKSWVLHSTILHGLFDNALTNTERLFSYDGVHILRDPFGRMFVVTDSPALYNASGATYNSLGLVEDAIVVNDNNDFFANMVTSNGDENIKASYQAEWTFGAAVKGYAWDMSSGGKSPTDTAIGTPTNWDKIASSNKDTAGVLLVSK